MPAKQHAPSPYGLPCLFLAALSLPVIGHGDSPHEPPCYTFSKESMLQLKEVKLMLKPCVSAHLGWEKIHSSTKTF